MEMDIVQRNHNGDTDDAFSEQLLSSESPDVCDIFGEPDVLPRVGDEYQVQIPPLVTESDLHWLSKNPTDAKSLASDPDDFLMGLPISIMWINMNNENVKHELLESVGNSADISGENETVKSECTKEGQILSEGALLKLKVDPTDNTLDCEMKMGESAELALQQKMEIEFHEKHRCQGYYPVPGSFGVSWSDTEEASFLLGLYIFGKNLTQVKKFVESKSMGDVLSFYYGKFYRSDKYRKWVECRRVKSRRCIYGQRIFTGLRQQELFSRLFRHVSEECQNTLLEVTKTLGEGKMLLEEYVFTLKAAVGLNPLIEAVGIGKGKEDLTGMAMEPAKSKQVVSVRPEIPMGKACSALSPLEIVDYLTGDYRLSKARSNDLFWEAVWPRLLARGWHSEQPKGHSCAAGSKHPLVFLVPGIKKFSRSKLVKGNHYFDSVSDVLSKVASEPALIELENGADKGDNKKEENQCTEETKLDQEGFPDKQRHYYLKPRTPARATHAMKFTVVDTSLGNVGTLSVREIRTLPVETNSSACRTHSEDSDGGDTSEESTHESESADTLSSDRDKIHSLKPGKNNVDKVLSFDRNNQDQRHPINDPDSSIGTVKIPQEKDRNACNNVHPRKGMKDQANQRMKSENKNQLGPVTKRRRRLTACSRTETVRSTVKSLVDSEVKKQEEVSFCSVNPDHSTNVLSQMDSVNAPEEKLSSTGSMSKGSPVNDSEAIGISNSSEHPSQKRHQPRTLIDLNLPVSPDAETEGLFMTEMRGRERDQTAARQPENNPITLKASQDVPGSDLKHNTNNAHRQSTRNRPLTTKALEALACGFLTVKQKRKCRDGFPPEPRPSRRARARATVAENFADGIVDFKAEERVNGVHDTNGELFSKLPV